MTTSGLILIPVWPWHTVITLLLLLRHFSRVWLCVTPKMAAHQAPPSLGFSRQEHWSGLPFPPPMHESEVAQLCPTLRDPMDSSLPGSSVHGILQAIVLEWIAIPFSRGSSWPGDRTQVSHIVDRRFTIWATREGNLVNIRGLKCWKKYLKRK